MGLFYKGKHHRNPSGLKNKINWLKKVGNNDEKEMLQILKEIEINYSRMLEDNEIDGISVFKALKSWSLISSYFKEK